MAVAEYLSKECGCDFDWYIGDAMKPIVLEALYDYIDGCEVPSSLMRGFFENRWIDSVDYTNRILAAFVSVRISRDKKLINGFTEQLLANAKNTLNGEYITKKHIRKLEENV